MTKIGLVAKGFVYLALVTALIGVTTVNAQTVSTFASGFGQADGIAFDSSGNMYFSARSQNKIMKITPAGVVSTFAGSGTYGAVDGAAATAQFSSPDALTVDPSGNVYVNEKNSYKIRKITQAGVVSTFKNFSVSGEAPLGILADPSGNLFYFHKRELHKIDSAGTDTVVAGRSGCNSQVNGTGTAACFSYPMDLARDSGGNLYTVENTGSNNVVRKITPTYVVTELGARGKLGQPISVTVDASGDVYVGTGSVGNKIFKVTQAGAISVYTGTGTAGSTDGALAVATFSYPGDLAFSGGELYVADYNNGKVRKINLGPAPKKNVALASNGGMASASTSINATTFPPISVINGDRKGINWANGGGWNDGTSNVYPDWIQVDFSGTKTIDEIDVFTCQDNYNAPAEPTQTMTTSLGIKDFVVQYWNGSSWVTITGGTVTGNNRVWKQFIFTMIQTSKIRVTITNAADYSRITELEAWGPN